MTTSPSIHGAADSSGYRSRAYVKRLTWSNTTRRLKNWQKNRDWRKRRPDHRSFPRRPILTQATSSSCSGSTARAPTPESSSHSTARNMKARALIIGHFPNAPSFTRHPGCCGWTAATCNLPTRCCMMRMTRFLHRLPRGMACSTSESKTSGSSFPILHSSATTWSAATTEFTSQARSIPGRVTFASPTPTAAS